MCSFIKKSCLNFKFQNLQSQLSVPKIDNRSVRAAMKIGIMGAMPEEINGIKDDVRFTNFVLFKTIGGKEYYRHCDEGIGGHELFLVFSGWGKVAASSVATTLINEFDVDTIIFTG